MYEIDTTEPPPETVETRRARLLARAADARRAAQRVVDEWSPAAGFLLLHDHPHARASNYAGSMRERDVERYIRLLETAADLEWQAAQP